MLGRMLENLSADARLRTATAASISRSIARIERLDPRVLLSAGVLDSSFGGTGLVTNDFGFGDDFGYAVTVQNDGRILVAGTVRGANGSNDFGVTRFNADGTLDATFGTAGRVTTDFAASSGTSLDDARAIVVEPVTGRIYVAGFTNRGSGNDFAIARYNPDGSLDTSFGTAGKVVTNFSTNDQAMAMALQSDGKLVVGGMAVGDFGLARYNANGSLDTSFGVNGFAHSAMGTGQDVITSMSIRADGKIVAGGYAQFTSDFDFAAAIYNVNGSLDTSFNGTGRVTTNVGLTDQATSMVLLPDGRFVLAGRTDGDVLMVRYNTNGTRDGSFGAGGIATVDLGSGNDTANAMLRLSDGSMVLAGGVGSGTSRDFAVFRVSAAGSLDALFGTGGITRSSFATNSDEAYGITTGADGNLLVVGRTTATGIASSYNFALARYISNDAPIAVISCPTAVPEGSAIALNGAGSSDIDGTIVAWEWDLDYDGSSFTVDATGSSASFSAAGLDGPTSRMIALRVTDNLGATHVVSRAINVTNVAPNLSISGAGNSTEGSAYMLMLGSVNDPGSDTVSQYVIHWGDGSSSVIDAANLPADRSVMHTFADDGSYAITIDLTDEDGSYLNRANALSVAVSDVPPTLTISGSLGINEGSSYALTLGLVSDPGVGDSVSQYIIHWGDGSTSLIDAADLAGDRIVQHTFADGSNAYSISVDLVDQSGTHSGSSNALAVTVNDVPPSLSISGNSSANEGSAWSLLLGQVSDPGADSIVRYIIHWGDGSSSTIDAANLPADRMVAHTFADNGTYAITIDLVDEDGTHIGRANAFSLGVNNVAPAGLTLQGPAGGTRGQNLSYTVSFTDAGVNDTHRVRWEFGDGSIFEADVTGYSATMSHAFQAAGTFTVKVTILDNAGGSSSTQMGVAITEQQQDEPRFQFVSDPLSPGRKMLIVAGTAGNDVIRLRGKKRGVTLWFNGAKLGVFNVTSRIVVSGGAGNDLIAADERMDLPVEFSGNAGNDTLRGGAVNDILDGGEGNDLLAGNSGNDLLIGCAGSDILHGGRGNDTLKGGAGRDYMYDAFGTNTFVYDSLDWKPKAKKK